MTTCLSSGHEKIEYVSIYLIMQFVKEKLKLHDLFFYISSLVFSFRDTIPVKIPLSLLLGFSQQLLVAVDFNVVL